MASSSFDAANTSKMDKYKASALKLYESYMELPLWLRIVGTVLALTIIIDGAVLFFALIGGFGYLSNTMQALVQEQSIQIINAAFSFICIMELPFRLQGAYLFVFSEFSNCCNERKKESTSYISENSESNSPMKPTNRYQSDLFTEYTWSRHYYYTFGILTFTKLFQIAMQFGVEYLCLAYAGPNNYQHRPATLFAVFIGFALPLGCGIGIAEGILKGWAEEKKNSNTLTMAVDSDQINNEPYVEGKKNNDIANTKMSKLSVHNL